MLATRLSMLPLILTGVLLNAAAQLLLKAGMSRVGHFAFSLQNTLPIAIKVASTPEIALGLLSYVVSVVIWMLVLSRVEVSFAYPLVSIGYIVTAVAAYFLFNENLSLVRIIGILVIMLGVYLMTRS